MTTGTLTKGVVGFGTVSHIVRNLRLPTLANTHYLALTQDERPVAAGEYTQYSIRIKTDRGPMGMSVVGQNVESVTDHIFYVLSTQVSGWDSALATAGITVGVVGPTTDLTVTSGLLDISNIVGGGSLSSSLYNYTCW